MFGRLTAFGFAVAVALAGAPALSAEKAKPTPEASPKKEAEPVSNDPQNTTATFGDWVERCQRVAVATEMRKVCEVALTVTATGQNGPLAEIAVGRARKADPLRLTLVLPVNVGFPSAPKLTLDGGEALELVWRQCVPAGCFADSGISGEQLSALRDAKTAKVDSKASTGQTFNFAVSLRGLPQALDAMSREP
jgi:invasion protein IalB